MNYQKLQYYSCRLCTSCTKSGDCLMPIGMKLYLNCLSKRSDNDTKVFRLVLESKCVLVLRGDIEFCEDLASIWSA